jgi:mannitol/fructose-specific phosphotransferase system IIA component (Ntr-type)
VSVAFSPLPIDSRLVFPRLASRTLEELLREMSESLAALGVIGNPEELAERLRRREREGCTGLGKEGVAFPHCRMQGLSGVVLAIGVSDEGIDFGTADGRPITLVFLLLSPQEAPAEHLQVLARLARLAARAPGLAERVRGAESAQDIVRMLHEAEMTTSAAATA